MLVRIEHPETGPQKSYLTVEVQASATSSTVENNTGFNAGDYVLLGHLGEEKTEIVTLDGISGETTVLHSVGPVFAHPVRTPIFEMKYNQAEVYSATSQNGSYSLVATVDLDVDEDYTTYDDSSGGASTWYKVRYKNSAASTFSDYSDAVQGTGYTSDSLRDMTDEVLEEFGDPLGKSVTRKRVKNLLRAGVRKLATELVKNFPDYRRTYVVQQLVGDQATYDLPARFLAFQRVDINFESNSPTNAYKGTFENEYEGYPDTAYATYEPRIFLRGEQYGIRPTPTSSNGYAYLWYWDYPAEMDSESDEHGLPYGARDVLVIYALWRLWASRQAERSQEYRNLFKDSLSGWLEFIAQRRQGYKNQRIDVVFGSDLYETD